MKRCNLSRFLMFSIIIMMFVSCKKEKNESNLPLVKTVEVSNIDETTVTCGGNIASDGNSKVTERGVCWSAVSNATILGNHTSDGSGIGSFTSNISGLTGNMTYYVRAYATNSVGTAYGEEKVFKTKQTNNSLPTVSSATVSNISSTTATCGGNVTSDGNSAVTAKGVCWSTSQNPTIANNKTNDGQGMGTFTSNITGLTTGTTYYVRAYATNRNGTSYGEQRSFKPSLDGSFTDSRDGKAYATIEIGNQTWMAENLRYLPSISGSSNGSSTQPLYYVYDYEGTNIIASQATENYSKYGVLYNFEAAINACPSGWHLPDNEEWVQLCNFLGGASTAAYKLKNQTGWNAGGGGNNSSRFSALPGGYRDYDGYFSSSYGSGFWWTASQNQGNNIYKKMTCSSNEVQEGSFSLSKENGYSVRCVKD